eukprot:364904-Chlamydomonas_euryale.AAC.26
MDLDLDLDLKFCSGPEVRWASSTHRTPARTTCARRGRGNVMAGGCLGLSSKPAVSLGEDGAEAASRLRVSCVGLYAVLHVGCYTTYSLSKFYGFCGGLVGFGTRGHSLHTYGLRSSLVAIKQRAPLLRIERLRLRLKAEWVAGAGLHARTHVHECVSRHARTMHANTPACASPMSRCSAEASAGPWRAKRCTMHARNGTHTHTLFTLYSLHWLSWTQ